MKQDESHDFPYHIKNIIVHCKKIGYNIDMFCDRRRAWLLMQSRLFHSWPSQGGSSVFGSLVILNVARCYLWLFLLYINIKIGKNSC